MIWIFLCTLVSASANWVWIVEPSFMDYKVRRPIAGSDRTILALVQIRDGEIYAGRGGRLMGIAQKFIAPEAAATAERVLESIKPRFVRDQNGVIQYAALESTNPLTASAVLAPGFAKKFASTLGPDLLVAMPNRYLLLVFSRQDQAAKKMSETIISGYLGSNYPVSREIFSLEKNGTLRSLGVLP